MKYKYLDPQQIIAVVVCLVVLGVGVFAFFTVSSNLDKAVPNAVSGYSYNNWIYNKTHLAVKNGTNTGGQIFNILGIVIMIGAIMSIIGIIYSYLRPY